MMELESVYAVPVPECRHSKRLGGLDFHTDFPHPSETFGSVGMAIVGI